MHKKTVLKNGIRLVTEHFENVRSVSIGIWVLAGSAYETQNNNGISHFIEHMFFKGTPSLTAKQIA
ncbi:MAG: insulinase family protein, partial [Clostridia bacterium]